MKRLSAQARSRIATVAVLAALTVAAGAPARADILSLATVPLFLGAAIEPNIMFTLDDSGSMYWSYMPDEISADNNDKRGLAYRRNRLAYNPYLTYQVPLDATGTAFPNASFSAAWDDGYRAFQGLSTCTLDLGGAYRPTWYYGDHCNGVDDYTNEYHTEAAGEAYYYIHYQDHPVQPQGVPTNCTAGSTTDNDCYIKVLIRTTQVNGRSVDQERQNFANWYSYYRKRTYMAKAGVGRAFAQLATQSGSAVRVGFGRINRGNVTRDGFTNNTVDRGVRLFEDRPADLFGNPATTDRTDFFDLLYEAPASGSTPLRRAADEVGQYFQVGGDQGPWNDTPGPSARDGNDELACRQSYHIVMSDGYWNSTGASAGPRANNDGTTANNTSQYNYSPVSPFTDIYGDPGATTVAGGTLADIAMYYWKRDLRPAADKVPVNADDPAFWQHLVTFTVGLGLGGAATCVTSGTTYTHIDPTAAFNAIGAVPPVTITWPRPAADSECNIDDMLHAAVNSRGGFFSAQDPATFANAMTSILQTITDRTGSAASVVLNSGALQSNSRVYQARFQTSNWGGQLLSYALNSDGSVGALQWDAATRVPAASARLIATYDGNDGIPFRWSDLTTVQKQAIDAASEAGGATSSPLLDYLRGVRTNERPTGSYRARSSLLGDIVNSAPAFVGAPNAPYYFSSWGTEPPPSGAAAPENGHPYTEFQDDQQDRTPMIYVGANDGMLHAFNANTGDEVFAYVPSKVLPRMGGAGGLWDPAYMHRYYVDGSPTTGDTFFGGAWHTVLVGGLNGGGQSIYALDITDPTVSTESAAAGKVLWEFSDANTAASGAANGDNDLGYTYSRPSIVRMNNGRWAAVFGNGYNNTARDDLDLDGDGVRACGADGVPSGDDDAGDGPCNVSSTGRAVLYVVDIETGRLIKKIDTLTGPSADPLGEARPNGLATVAPVDRDGDFKVDFIYAGDLYGNLWKFDVGGASTTAWGVAYSGQPLFQARATPSNPLTAQPITTRPQVVRHPGGGEGFVVLFGTGKYLENVDNRSDDQTTQTFYGIWDRPSVPPTASSRPTRNHLLQQEIIKEVTPAGGFTYRVTTQNPMRWYYKASTGPNLPATSGADREYVGWYMDLYNTNEGASTENLGERQVADSILRGGKIIFTTLVPTDDRCDFGGEGWLMELDAATGARLPYSPFDVNNDGIFDLNDYINVGDITGDGTEDVVPPSGRKSTVGIIPMPAVISREGGRKEHKYESGSTGQIEMILENPGPGDFGRQSWRQLFR
jgi:type IV pilus assembly protein PilY1